MNKTISSWVGALAVAAAIASPAAADEKREFKFSYNVGITSDYVFRGFSQSADRPTGQAGIDATYGILYAGIWGSGIDFGFEGTNYVAKAEIDFYAGIKPVWKGITFDLGVKTLTGDEILIGNTRMIFEAS